MRCPINRVNLQLENLCLARHLEIVVNVNDSVARIEQTRKKDGEERETRRVSALFWRAADPRQLRDNKCDTCVGVIFDARKIGRLRARARAHRTHFRRNPEKLHRAAGKSTSPEPAD